MTARQVCLGWHWYPYAYARTVVDGDGAPGESPSRPGSRTWPAGR